MRKAVRPANEEPSEQGIVPISFMVTPPQTSEVVDMKKLPQVIDSCSTCPFCLTRGGGFEVSHWCNLLKREVYIYPGKSYDDECPLDDAGYVDMTDD